MTSIKAIPTTYNGTKYRSRTEARWAIFFDLGAIPFRYEAEGYETEGGRYLPDFELTGADQPVYFEVKPGRPKQLEMAKLTALCRGDNSHVFVALGSPGFNNVIWRVFPDASHELWHFAYEDNGRISYLTDRLIGGPKVTLAIRSDAGPLRTHAAGVMAELAQAGGYQFPLYDRGNARQGGFDLRDWRQRARVAEQNRLARRGVKLRTWNDLSRVQGG